MSKDLEYLEEQTQKIDKEEALEFQEQEIINLLDTTFMIPLRIETQDRMRNIITTLIYLLRGLDCRVIVKEFDKESVFEKHVLPVLKEAVHESHLLNLTHVFEQSDEYTFHRTRLLNDMTMMAETPIVVNYDSDIILPKQSYLTASQTIRDGNAKCVYPYGYGEFQYQVFADDEMVSEFINSNFNFKAFTKMKKWDAKFGFCQWFDREEYIKLGMENENFISYGYEDDERFMRFSQLTEVARIDDAVYHLEHQRTSNSWFNNPHIEANRELYKKLGKLSEKGLRDYYETVPYMMKRRDGQK